MKICASGILLKGNKILLGKRAKNLKFYPDVWDSIGGHCKKNETPERTLCRELREEIGVTPTKLTQIGVFNEPEPEKHGDHLYYIYLITDWVGSPKNFSPVEHSEIGWFQINEALKLKLAHPQYPELFKSIEMIMTKAI